MNKATNVPPGGGISNPTDLPPIPPQPFVIQINNIERMRVDVTGNVGIGTPKPAARLHLLSSDNPTVMRIQSSQGFGAGRIEFWSDPEGSSNQWRPGFIQSTDSGGFTGGLAFFVNGSGYDARTGQTEVMRIVNGKVGIGTTSPSHKLDVAGEVHASDFLISSDVRLKTDVAQLTNVLEKLENIRGISFQWNEASELQGCATRNREIGVIAQELEAVFPELVTTWDKEGYKAVGYSRLTAVLIEAIKELKAEKDTQTTALEADNVAHRQQIIDLRQQLAIQQQDMETLKAENAVLRRLNVALETRLAALERAMRSPSTEIESLVVLHGAAAVR